MHTHVKKGTIILTAGVAVLISSFAIPWHMFLPPLQVVQRWEWEVPPGVVRTAPIELIWGTQIHGLVYVQGGNGDIDFSITDSEGSILHNPGRISSGYAFRWQAPKTDLYHFEYDNSFSWFTTKTVGYRISLYYYSHLFLVAGVITIPVGIYFIVKGLVRTVPTEKIVFCRNCGTKNTEDAKYCKKCGKEMGEKTS